MKYKVSVIKKIAFLVMTMALAVAMVVVQWSCRERPARLDLRVTQGSPARLDLQDQRVSRERRHHRLLPMKCR